MVNSRCYRPSKSHCRQEFSLFLRHLINAKVWQVLKTLRVIKPPLKVIDLMLEVRHTLIRFKFQQLRSSHNLRLGFTCRQLDGLKRMERLTFQVTAMVDQTILKHKTKLLRLFRKSKIVFTNRIKFCWVKLETQTHLSERITTWMNQKKEKSRKPSTISDNSKMMWSSIFAKRSLQWESSLLLMLWII